MLRHDLKILFIHINKTGGSSIVRALNMLQVHLSVDLIFSSEIENDDQFNIWEGWKNGKRRTTYNWDKLTNIKNYWNEYKSFSIVRNPWDRVVSDFFYCKKENYVPVELTFRNEVLYNKDNFERWKQPCYNWLTLNGEVAVQNILRFENLQSDFEKMCKQLELPDGINLPHLNKTKHKHYTEYYDEETKQIVAEKYAKDIEYFGYEFGE
jgi:hypothetical protein